MNKFPLALCAITLCSCSEEKSEAPAPRPVISAVVGTAASAGGYPGVIEARVTSDLGFRVLGNLNSRTVEVGDQVSKGQILATLDSSAQLFTVSAAEADLRNAIAKRDNAEISNDRQKTLARSGIGTTVVLEQTDQALKSAIANVSRAAAVLAQAREQLDYTVLRAPFDGIVTKTAAEAGQTVEAGATIVTVAQPREREVVIDIPDGIYARMQPGTAFDVRLQLDEDVIAHGVVRELAPSADTSTRTRRVRISLVAPGQGFRIGSVVTAYFSGGDMQRIVIPRRAIGTADGSFVWLIDASGTVRRREIQVDGSDLKSDIVSVSGDLKSGDRIVLAGVSRLIEGQPVRTPEGDPR